MSCHDSSQELVVKYGTVTGPLLEEADCLRLLGATTQLLLPQEHPGQSGLGVLDRTSRLGARGVVASWS
ncbi:hypothetical protein JCM11251_002099 [Rhodosporidiobolus azoricus]